MAIINTNINIPGFGFPAEIDDLIGVAIANPQNDDNLFYQTSSGKWINKQPGTKGWSIEVNAYTDLPAASGYTNLVALVKNDSGTWPFKKKAGFWRSTGTAWQWLGVLALGSMADVNISGITDGQGIIYDSANAGFIPGTVGTYADIQRMAFLMGV